MVKVIARIISHVKIELVVDEQGCRRASALWSICSALLQHHPPHQPHHQLLHRFTPEDHEPLPSPHRQLFSLSIFHDRSHYPRNPASANPCMPPILYHLGHPKLASSPLNASPPLDHRSASHLLAEITGIVHLSSAGDHTTAPKPAARRKGMVQDILNYLVIEMHTTCDCR